MLLKIQKKLSIFKSYDIILILFYQEELEVVIIAAESTDRNHGYKKHMLQKCCRGEKKSVKNLWNVI